MERGYSAIYVNRAVRRFAQSIKYCLLTYLAWACHLACAADAPALLIDANLYPYLDRFDSDTDFTLVTNAPLPGGISYFSFVNVRGTVSDGSTRFVRSEQNLRWSVSDKAPIDLNLQAILAAGNDNDQLQLGAAWRVSDTRALEKVFQRLNLTYRVNFHLKRFTSGDEKVWQLEHFFRMTFPDLTERLYISGFVDQTFDLDLPEALPANPIVAEVQLGVRLFDRFYAVTEYRVNRLRRTNEYNLAAGIEYKFRW